MSVCKLEVLLVVSCLYIVDPANSSTATERITKSFLSYPKLKGNKSDAVNDTESCKLEIFPGQVDDIKSKLLEIMSNDDTNLVYIHIKATTCDPKNKTERLFMNRLKEWQFVDKNEKFLVQLPVDIDMVTFNLFETIGEEKHITIPMRIQNINCIYSEISVKNTKRYLWENLLGNFSDNYILCNRNFTVAKTHKAFYWITTIWIGYDLSCTQYDDKIISAGKFTRPNIIPIVCFLLALQYVWIYAFINFHHEENDFHYRKGDSPYSIKRGIQKCLYRRVYTKADKQSQDKQKKNSKTSKKIKAIQRQINSPVMRLTFVFYFMVLFPVSLYRTIYRHEISKSKVPGYLDILKPSEPLCSRCKDDKGAFLCDLVIASASTVLGAFLVLMLYEILAGKTNDIKTDDKRNLIDVFLASCRQLKLMWFPDKEDESPSIEEERGEDNAGFVDNETPSAFGQVQREEWIGNTEKHDSSDEQKSKDEHAEERKGDCCLLGKSVQQCFVFVGFYILLVPFVLSMILLIAMLSLSLFLPFLWFISYPMIKILYPDCTCKDCKCTCKKCKCMRKECKCTCTCRKCKCTRKECKCTCKKFKPSCKESKCTCKECKCTREECKYRAFLFLFVFVTFPCILFTQRVILSSIIFLLRLITYFIFVALPVRTNLFRYFLIAVTALGYIGKYHSELVNMATEVLDEIFRIRYEMQIEETHFKTTVGSETEMQIEETHDKTTDGFETDRQTEETQVKTIVGSETDRKIEETQVKTIVGSETDRQIEETHVKTTDSFETNTEQTTNENSSKTDFVEEEILERVMVKLRFKYRWYVFIIKCFILIAYIFITVEALLNSGKLKSSSHFEQFLSFLFIALSPAVVQKFYKVRDGYLNDEHKLTIRDKVIRICTEIQKKRNNSNIDIQNKRNKSTNAQCNFISETAV